MAFAVVACSRCRTPWAVELRHSRSSCPRCRTQTDLKRRRRLWEGDSADGARAAAGKLAAALAQGLPEAQAAQAVEALAGPAPMPRHDSPTDAAAAQARSIRNLGARAEEVALWLTRLQECMGHDELVDALRRAGIPATRAEKEIIRMLACDILFEPRAGTYQILHDA